MASGTSEPVAAFTRRSSGLVRQVSSLDTIFYGLGQIGIPYVSFITVAWIAYPGASMELATLITVIGALALGITYALFASVYPRSGGEYVFLSRILHPSVGMAVSLINTFWEIFYVGINGVFWALFGWAPLFLMLGLQLHNSTLTNAGTWITSPWGLFVCGSALVLFFGVILHRGMKLYFRVQKWSMWLAFACLLVSVVVLAITASGGISFAHQFNATIGAGAYQRIIHEAVAAHTNLSPSFSLSNTLTFMIWPAFAVLFAVFAVSFAGEIKRASRNTFIGITGAMLASGVALAVLMFFTHAAVGTRFELAITSLPIAKTGLPTMPWATVFAAIAGGNPVLTVIINLWVLLLIPYAAGTAAIYASRAMFAWGLDGLGPSRLGSVSDRLHTPGFAIFVTCVLAEVWLCVYAFTSLVTILSGLLGFAVAFLITALVGIVFPFRNKEVFQASPAAIKLRGVPILPVIASIASILLAFIVYRAVVDKTYGAGTVFSLWVNLVVFVVGFAWYYGARWYRRSQGIDLAARYKEIPVE